MANQKILELEATLKDTASLADNSTEITNLKITLNRTAAKAEEESSRMKSQVDELQKRLDNAGKDLSEGYEIFLRSFREKIHRQRYNNCHQNIGNQCNGRTLCSILRKS